MMLEMQAAPCVIRYSYHTAMAVGLDMPTQRKATPDVSKLYLANRQACGVEIKSISLCLSCLFLMALCFYHPCTIPLTLFALATSIETLLISSKVGIPSVRRTKGFLIAEP